MRYLMCLGAVAAFAVAAAAQTTTTPVPTSLPGGTVVGKPMLQPVGSSFNNVGSKLPSVGNTMPVGSITKQSANFDKSLVVAPYPGSDSNPFWDFLTAPWKMLFPEKPTPPNGWTPGIGRRNRERREMQTQFRRD